MSDAYLLNRLLGWAELMYGKDTDCYSKKKKGHYVFGSRKRNYRNVVSKQFAIYICVGTLPYFQNTKKMYQILYFSLVLNKEMIYASGAAYNEDEAKAEIKALQKNQKNLKKLGEPRTQINFALKEITVRS